MQQRLRTWAAAKDSAYRDFIPPEATCPAKESMNKTCSFQRRHIHSQTLGGSMSQLMHKEVVSSRPEETLCVKEKILKH
ncbi:hypothetical protein PFLUV_G00244270 [Perca fluviatilis]|uniref:Uncharacterized protein n=1 Tax=Perca fluviatilis TaxID=8168 RepID=A0A6A5ECZ8_PERFL|nr:hypothetical protein PFLUV_G00244270 [Perca fluviatilis]